eukprot:1159753-Pelagomonas_calceolata.AAC.1
MPTFVGLRAKVQARKFNTFSSLQWTDIKVLCQLCLYQGVGAVTAYRCTGFKGLLGFGLIGCW